MEKFYALYGKPERILFAISRPVSDVERLNKKIYEYADKGNFIEVIVKDKYSSINLIKHGNVKKIIFSSAFFEIIVWFRIFMKKKKYNRLFINRYE